MNIRHPKVRGEWAELRFMTRATELGFIVTKPWGDSAPFDLSLVYRRRFAASRSNAPSSTAATPTNATSTPTESPTAPTRSTSSPRT